MKTTQGKTIRIEAYIDSQTKEFVAQAAVLTGQGLNEFLVQAATKEARETIGHMSSIEVSTESANRMLKCLDNPEPINPKLRSAVLNHKKIERDFR